MLRAMVAHSRSIDAQGAADDLIRQNRDLLEAGSNATTVSILLSGHGDPEHGCVVLRNLQAKCPAGRWIGSGSYAETSESVGGYVTQTTALLTLAAPMRPSLVRFASGVCRCLQDSDQEAAQAAALDLLKQFSCQGLVSEDVKAVIVFAEMQIPHISAFLSALQGTLPSNAVIVGGASAYPNSIQLNTPSWQFFGSEALQGSAVAVAIGGDVDAYAGFSNVGWEPLTREFVRAKSRKINGESNRREIFQIAGQRAADYYRQTLQLDVLPTALSEQLSVCAPLAIRGALGEVQFIDVLEQKLNEGVLEVIADCPDACDVAVVLPHPDAMLMDLQRMTGSLQNLIQEDRVRPVVCLYFACCSRPIALQAINEDLSAEHRTMSSILPGLPILGFHGYMEYGARAPGAGVAPEGMSIVSLLLAGSQSEQRQHIAITRHLMQLHEAQGFVANRAVSRPARAGAIKARHLAAEARALLDWAAACWVEKADASCCSPSGGPDFKGLAQDIKAHVPSLPGVASLTSHLRQAFRVCEESQYSGAPTYLETIILGVALHRLSDDPESFARNSHLSRVCLAEDLAREVLRHPLCPEGICLSDIATRLIGD